MEFQDKLDEVVAFVESARTLPMSSAIVIDRKELTRLLDELRWRVPEDVVAAQAVLKNRQELLSEATANAEQLLEAAAMEQHRLVSDHEVLREARAEANEVVRAARRESEQVAKEAADYVDAKLAYLEVAVGNVLGSVRQGRDQLTSTLSPAEMLTESDPAPSPKWAA